MKGREVMEEIPFRIPALRWFMRMVAFYPPARVPLAIFGGGALLTAVAGLIWDLRLLVIALMIVMLLIPMLAALLFFNYGLLPVNSLNLTLHRIKIGEDEIAVEIVRRKVREEEEQDSGKREEKEVSPAEYETLRLVRVPLSAIISRCATGGGGEELTIEMDGHRQLLILPPSVVGEENKEKEKR